MLLTLAVAAGLRILRDRSELRKVLLGCVVAGAGFVALFVILNPYALLNLHEARRQIRGQSGQAAAGKLGQDDVLGWVYYVGTLGWGLGWLPLAAAVGGAVVAIRRDWRARAAAARVPRLPLPVHGLAGPLLRPLAAARLPGAVHPRGLRGGRARHGAQAPGAALRACFGALLCAQGLLASVHVDRVLGREDTRAQALDWLRANVPEGGRIVVEPFVPADWAGEFDKWPVERPFQAYEKRLRVKRHRRLPRGRLLLRRRREHAEGARAEGRAAVVGALLPGARRRERGDGHVLALRRGRRPGRVLLRLLVQLRAARLPAPRAGGGDPPPRATAIPAEPGSG